MVDRLTKQENLDLPEGVTLANYPYKLFLINITEHVSVPKHEIVPHEEVNAFCKRYYTTREQFSKISVADPQAIWLGLQPGMVVKVTRTSETAGEAPSYRICIK
jgi:DNA-directed RNA polymerase subunit H (RpoH/RPB5)